MTTLNILLLSIKWSFIITLLLSPYLKPSGCGPRISAPLQQHLQFRKISYAIEAYQQDCLHYPEQLNQLIDAKEDCSLAPYLKLKNTIDLFGNPIHYHASSTGISLISIGIDRTINTVDDIRYDDSEKRLNALDNHYKKHRKPAFLRSIDKFTFFIFCNSLMMLVIALAAKNLD